MTPDLLMRCTGAFPGRALQLAGPLSAAMAEYGINTPEREALFLAQCAHESGSLVFLRELWGPTDAQRRYEPPDAKAASLGNTQPGDGLRYRGRGLIQITGRANYRACGLALKLPLESAPEQLEQPVPACRSAGWFWATHGLNELADIGAFKTSTLRINGGLNGLEDRMARWTRAKDALGVTT